MSHRTYEVVLDGRSRKVEVGQGYWSSRRVVRVDGVEVFRVVPRSFREQTDMWQNSMEHPFAVDGHRFVLRVRPALAGHDVELVVDGRSLEDGLPAGPLRPPAVPPYGWTGIKLLILTVAFLLYLFLVIVPFGTFARTSGDPRWILAANVLFDLSLPVAAAVAVIFAWQSRLRGRNVTMALFVFALAAFVFREGFVEAADLVVPLDEETIAFVGWDPGPLDLRRVKLVGGPEVEFANDMPVRWRRLPPGNYVLVRGHFSRVILDMRLNAP